MAKDPDFERIRQKAHELWEAEGHPHGRHQEHWDQAREMVAIEDSQGSTLLPGRTGAKAAKEPRSAVDSLGDMPGLTDQGRNDLTDTSREPSAAKVVRAKTDATPKPAASPKSASASTAPAAKAKAAATLTSAAEKIAAPSKPTLPKRKS